MGVVNNTIDAKLVGSVFGRYNIIDRRDMAYAVRQLEAHEKKLAAARISYNSGYNEPSQTKNTLPDDPTNPIIVN